MKKLRRVITCICLFWPSITLLAQPSAVPGRFNYQGMLLDPTGAPFTNGNYGLSFSIYTSDTSPTNVWGPQRFDNGNGFGHYPQVTVVTGQFNVVLGDVDTSNRALGPILLSQSTSNFWLEITVTNNNPSLNPISPRQQMLSAPFALSSANSEKFAGTNWSAVFDNGDPNTGSFLAGKIKPITPAQLNVNSFSNTFWGLTGNSGTIPGTHFIGTTDNQPLDFRANNSQALRIDTNGYVGIGTTLPGAPLHVSGGGFSTTLDGNEISFSRNGGPAYIFASNRLDFVTGGRATSDGSANLVLNSDASSYFNGNVGIGTVAPVAQLDVVANGQASLRMHSQNANNGSILELGNDAASSGYVGAINFTSSGSTQGQINYDSLYGMAFISGGSMRMRITASGNIGIGDFSVGGQPSYPLHVPVVNPAGISASFSGTVRAANFVTISDRNAKEGFVRINTRDILQKVLTLPITEWRFKGQDNARHIGPMAQDFYAAFKTGQDDRHITMVDEGGVALAAIQGLKEIITEQDSQIAGLQKEILELKSAQTRTISDWETRIGTLEKAIEHHSPNSRAATAHQTQNGNGEEP